VSSTLTHWDRECHCELLARRVHEALPDLPDEVKLDLVEAQRLKLETLGGEGAT
jgi:hypothetical protein